MDGERREPWEGKPSGEWASRATHGASNTPRTGEHEGALQLLRNRQAGQSASGLAGRWPG